MVVASRDEKTAIAETIGEYDMNKAKWVSKVVGRLCVVVVAGFPSVTQAQDSWTSIDKLNHFAFSAVIAAAAAKDHGPVAGAAIALVPGVIKELADMGGAGTPSMKDMAANVVGAMTGAILPAGFLVVPTTNQSGLFFTYQGSF